MSVNSKSTSIYDTGLDKNMANHVPLSPINFLRRSAAIYPTKTAVVYETLQFSYQEFYDRCCGLACALVGVGVTPGETVAVMAPNVPAMLECHYGVPMTGAVLNTINIRLDASTIAFILEHSEAKVFIVDCEYASKVVPALDRLKHKPMVVDIVDPKISGISIGERNYESFITEFEDSNSFSFKTPDDEWGAISLCYTSGTTGNPKGVVGHHRGAFLNSVSAILGTGLSSKTIYLWTLPMFHCNGWCFTWAVTAVAGAHVCLRRVEPASIFDAIVEHKINVLCGAPVVLATLLNAADEVRRKFDHKCQIFTGGAAPPSSVISGVEQLGFTVTQLYGLTETYGPALMTAWQDDWEELSLDDRAQFMSRQGVLYPLTNDAIVADSETLVEVPSNGKMMGEIMVRSNTVMKGYLKNRQATLDAFYGGWFHTGDLAVRHSNGYIEVKDRAKDVIISGGENISSLEIEEVLYRHPSVMEAAVVARPDKKWGETPCAFVSLKSHAKNVTDADLIAFCKENMAHFKVPKYVIFGEIQKTATGKIHKFLLREVARTLSETEK